MQGAATESVHLSPVAIPVIGWNKRSRRYELYWYDPNIDGAATQTIELSPIHLQSLIRTLNCANLNQ